MVVCLLLRRPHSWTRKPARLDPWRSDFLPAGFGVCGARLPDQHVRGIGPDSTPKPRSVVGIYRGLEHLDQLPVRANNRAVSDARLSRQQCSLAYAGSERDPNP